jgi:hypothetical protein
MIPPPSAIGLTLCDYVILEEGTRKISLVGSFTGLQVLGFPSVPQRFSVFAVLTDGMGDGTIELAVTQLETDQEIYSVRRSVHFPDRFMEVRVLFRVGQCSFPVPGTYLFTLLVDGDWIAHRRLRVYSSEEVS